jgi:molybdate-binding protein
MKPTLRLDDFAQIKSLADAQRQALLRRLMAGPASLTELGRHFEESPAHIRHHLKALEQAGLVEIDSTRPVRGFTEILYRATAGAYLIHLAVLPDVAGRAKAIVLGSNDQAVAGLAAYARQKKAHVSLQLLALDSLNGLIALQQGLCRVAGCHLLDPQTGEYNSGYIERLFPGQTMTLIRLAQREVGLMVKSGNPLRLRSLADLTRPTVRFVNRERGSGTRLWLDRALRQAGILPAAVTGYARELGSHLEVAQAVGRGKADAGLGLGSVAHHLGLDFVPLFEEPYDLVLPKEALTQPQYQLLFNLLCSGDFRQFVTGLTGYQTSSCGASQELSA